MNRFLRIVSAVARITWSLNGILLFTFLFIGGVFLLMSFINEMNYDSAQETIVGNNLDAQSMSQGIAFDQPNPILHTNHFLLPVYVRTGESPEDNSQKIVPGFSKSYYSFQEFANITNIVFLNGDMEPQSVLLDKKALITAFRYPNGGYYFESTPSDTIQRNITYLITFDSNNDGAIDGTDSRDLYLSDLDGGNLRKITTNVDVLDYYFLDRDRIMIKYQRRGGDPEASGREYLATYLIKDNKLNELSSLHETLNKIESIFVK